MPEKYIYFAVNRMRLRTVNLGFIENIQVSTHDHKQAIPARDVIGKESGIFDRLLGTVDRTWADDNDDPVIVSRKDARGSEACSSDGLLCSRA